MISCIIEMKAPINQILKMQSILDNQRFLKLTEIIENQILSQLKNNELPTKKYTKENFNNQELKVLIEKINESYNNPPSLG